MAALRRVPSRIADRRVRWAARHRASVVAIIGTLLAPLAVLLVSTPAVADTSVAPPGPASPWFGPQLNWADDLPADYSRRLGTTPSLYAQVIDYPLTEDSTTFLQQFAEQAATQGAVAVLTLAPTTDLDDLTAADAEELGTELAGLHESYDSTFLVRFAPEMNGSWQTWGQQPRSYVAAFRQAADAVHDATPDAAMVWSPSYGAGYPFRESARAVDPEGDVDDEDLDTDGDGTVTSADDPYGPYFPGDDYVDWVGLSLYYFGADAAGSSPNQAAAAGDYAGRLDESVGYGDDVTRESFYSRFAEAQDRPMLVDTAALWTGGGGGDSEQEVKQGWWRQVLAAGPAHPLIAGLTWLEVDRPEDEAGGADVDWRATRTSDLASALRADLAEAGVDLQATTRLLDQSAANGAAVQVRYLGDDDPGDEMGWIVACAVFLGLLFVFSGVAGRWLPSWRYPDEHDPRDRRLDLLRGMVIITVVFTHIELFSPYSFLSLKAVGAITGAEMFVMLSGVVLGMIYEPTVRKLGEAATAKVMLLRARKQYVVSLVVVLLVYALGRIPFVDATDITTFTDRGTGSDGTSTMGQIYNLYANGDRLLDYPPPWYAVKQLLLLEMGPWVFNIMGLFVVLSLLLPAMMYLIRRRLWWLLLAVSWAFYVWGSISDPHLFPSQFEQVFPLFIWQVAFTHGLVLGYYRSAITRVLSARLGKALVSLVVVGYAAVLGYLWLGQHYDFSVAPLPEGSYQWLYENAYVRVVLQPGRLFDLAFVIVVAYAVFTTCWKPIDKAIGWLWIPLGQASLYVFIVHVFFALAVANIPGLDRNSLWQGTVLHTVVILTIWWMVRHKVLFKVIPR